ncbi:hypothetical protein BGX38DRAFT_1138321 [Terfezia claveryi]|nr:hypothetical protein BGX38DRAFT_1138321 [Terfezia claveryi]
MASSEPAWSEQEAVQKVLRRAEVSRIARVLQHRLALATYKTKHGLEKLDLDTIEPRVEEDLKRKRSANRNSEPPGHFGEVDLEWLRENGGRSTSSFSEYGQTSRGVSPRKRPRPSTSDPQLPHPPPPRRPVTSWRESPRRMNSSPAAYGLGPHDGHRGYFYRDPLLRDQYIKYNMEFNSSPPQTPPPQFAEPVVGRQTGEDGEIVIFLSASPSPMDTMPKTMPFTPSTPPSRHSTLPSSVLPQTPQGVFNFADFVNITPSPAQAAFPPNTVRTPLTHAARKRLNFDNMGPPGSSGMNIPHGGRVTAISVLEIGGEPVK